MPDAQATFDIDARIRCIAATQLGLITPQQAASAGVDKHALARRRDAGALVGVFRHVMRLVPFEETPTQRALAACLAVPGATIAATSAAVIHQFPTSSHGMSISDEVLSIATHRRISTPGIVVVRQTMPVASTRWMTARVTTPAATLLLLPRFVDAWMVERCLDHALAHRLCTPDQIRRLLDEMPTRAVYRRRLLLELLDARADGIGHRSGQEQRVARWLTRAGVTGWTRNLKVNVASGPPVEVDFGWPASRVALEVSPFFTHGSRAKQERDAHRRRLLVNVGWRIVEATDPDLVSEHTFAPTIAALRNVLGAWVAPGATHAPTTRRVSAREGRSSDLGRCGL